MSSVIPALAQENIYKSTTSAKVYASMSLNNDCYVRYGIFTHNTAYRLTQNSVYNVLLLCLLLFCR